MQHANNDLTSEASLQRGARYYVNYCLGCHSARYVRYSRIGTDLGITTDQLIENLMFTGDKPQRTMEIAMPAADAKRWFGRTPPDLSLVARSRGADWIYNYLRSFHVDESRQWGVDNLALPGAAREARVPHVVVEVEARVVDPQRLPLERGPQQPLPVARDEVQARVDGVADRVDVDAAVGPPERAGVEERDAADVHVGLVVLEREHAGIEGGEALVARVDHAPSRARRTSPPGPRRLPTGPPEA